MGVVGGAAAVVHPPSPSPLAAQARAGDGRYGPLGDPDDNGIRLPEGFTATEVARSGERVGEGGDPWHRWPDGGATYAAGAGFLYVSNSEVAHGEGGASALQFDADGAPVRATRILAGTTSNCAGGATPWRTWLSCEEDERGRVWECDPAGEQEAEVRPALGVFKHEAVAADPTGRRLYLSEDHEDGRFYRFTPSSWERLDEGLLEVAAVVDESGSVSWVEVPDPAARREATRNQVTASTAFDRGEGVGYHDGVVYLATTGDNRVWAYDIAGERIEPVYDAADFEEEPPLVGVDNVTVSAAGEVYVCEDNARMELVMISPDGVVAPMLKVEGQEESELTGVAFDPSGTRLLFSSQRAFGDGATYLVTGPFDSVADSSGGGGFPVLPVGLGALALVAGIGFALRRRVAADEGADAAHDPGGPSHPS